MLCYVLTAMFYVVQVSVLGFTVYYLNENGYTAFEVGVLLAAFGIISAIAQRLLGYLADKYKKIDFKSILMCTSIILIILFITLYLFDKNKPIIGILFGITFALTNCMSPFVNLSCFYYTNKGFNVDYGKARGFGSLSFSIASFILGLYTKSFGSRAVSFNGIIFAIVFFLIVFFIPRLGNDDSEDEKKNLDTRLCDISIFALIKKYPSFFLMVLATTFAMCFQNADCGYLIQIIKNLGEDSSALGTANAIAAIVEIPIMFSITKIMKKIKVKKLIAVACGLYVVRGIVFYIPSMPAIYLAQVMQMFTYAILIPSTVYLSDEMMHNDDKNKGQTFIGMAVTVGLIFGSFVGGGLISLGGVNLLEVGCIFIAILSFIFATIGNFIKDNC